MLLFVSVFFSCIMFSLYFYSVTFLEDYYFYLFLSLGFAFVLLGCVVRI